MNKIQMENSLWIGIFQYIMENKIRDLSFLLAWEWDYVEVTVSKIQMENDGNISVLESIHVQKNTSKTKSNYRSQRKRSGIEEAPIFDHWLIYN